MKYKLLVLDLDGTLTNSKKEITPHTKEQLFHYMEAGGTVVLASGRPTFGIMPLAKELELDKRGGYILSFNGGNIIECKTGDIIYQKTLDAGIPEKLGKLTHQYGVCILSYENEDIISENPEDIYVQKEAFINKMPIKKLEDFSSYVRFPVTKCLMVGDGDRMQEVESLLKEEMGNGVNIFRSEPFFLEIMPEGIDKALSLKRLLTLLDMTKEEMAACGDGYNDISMIEFAGLGIAMENAQKEVKEIADCIAPSNDEDGIAWVIKEKLLG